MSSTSRPWKAIAAMAENRVIGADGKIPWHLPEDFRWFKQTTMGHTLVMGRKTFASIGKVLPGRSTVVLTRQEWSFPGVRVIRNISEIEPEREEQKVFIVGGAEIYRQTLFRCDELFLTTVLGAVAGDAFFPDPSEFFLLDRVLRVEPEFRIERWIAKVTA